MCIHAYIYIIYITADNSIVILTLCLRLLFLFLHGFFHAERRVPDGLNIVFVSTII